MTDKQSFTITANCGPFADEIAADTVAAFARQYGRGDGEAALIAGLRADGDVLVELAALDAGRVVGHVMFSRLSIEPAGREMAALAPSARE